MRGEPEGWRVDDIQKVLGGQRVMVGRKLSVRDKVVTIIEVRIAPKSTSITYSGICHSP